MAENTELKKMLHVLDFCEKVATGEHEDHADCWCSPTVEILKNGDKLVIHSNEHEAN